MAGGDGGVRGSLVFHSVGFLLATAFRVLPRPWRWHAAVALSRALRPLIRQTRAYEARARLRTDTLRETSLELILGMLTRFGVLFDPILRFEGAEHFPPPGSGQPLLLVGPHTMLSMLIVNWLEERGDEYFGIASDPGRRIYGTHKLLPIIIPSPSLFFDVRRHLMNGRFVLGMIDRGDVEPRNVEVETKAGTLRVSPALVHLAFRCGVPVLFFASWMNEWSEVVIRVTRPAQRDLDDLSGVVHDFVRFYEEHAAMAAG